MESIEGFVGWFVRDNVELSASYNALSPDGDLCTIADGNFAPPINY